MLKWIASKVKQEASDRSRHPLGTDAAVDEFLSDLPPGRSEGALLDIADWLGDPPRLAAGLDQAAVLRAVRRLDEHAEALVDATWQALLSESRLDHLGEQKLKSLDSFYHGRHLANRLCLDLLDQNPALGGNIAPNLKGLYAQRAINGLVGRLRVQHIRYRVPDAEWWQAATAIIASTQKSGVVNLKQHGYPKDVVASSPWLELMIALFFEISPLGNFTPQQMDLLLRILRWLEPSFMVQDSYSPQSPYCVHLDRLGVPVRVSASQAAAPNQVFIGTGMGYGRLITLRATIKKNGMPEWMAASRCTDDQAFAVIDALIMHWSEKPPQRRHQREEASAELRVVNGFANMRRMIAYSEFARSGRKVGYKSHLEMLKFERRGFADQVEISARDEQRWENATPLETLGMLESAGDRQLMDRWSLKDTSASGMGASAPFLRPWMAIGTYVGYRIDGELDWQIAIVRRIHRTPSGHPSIGLEISPETPRCAQVRRVRMMSGSDPWQEVERDGGAQGFLDAIVLSMSKSLLLLEPGVYSPAAILNLQVGGSRFAIRLLSIMHTSADCECVQYEICEERGPQLA